MKYTLTLAAALLVAFLISPQSAVAAEYNVVVNSANSANSLEMSELSRIYLGKRKMWEAEKIAVMPVTLDDKDPVTEAFIKAVTKKNVKKYQAYWRRMIFSGGGTKPKTFRTDAEVLDFVAKNPGAVGVIQSAQPVVRNGGRVLVPAREVEHVDTVRSLFIQTGAYSAE